MYIIFIFWVDELSSDVIEADVRLHNTSNEFIITPNKIFG